MNKLILVIALTVSLNACSTIGIGSSSISGKDVIRGINTGRSLSKINMPVIEQEFKMGIINTFGMHRNVN
jgi:hypothetical protein